MRALRWVWLGLASVSVGACGMIAGVDSYEVGDLTNPEDGSSTPNSVDSASKDAGPLSADTGALQPNDASTADVFVIIPNPDAGDAGHDSGPASDAACTAIPNGSNCTKGDAASCCSDICDETFTCSGNSCKANNGSCSNQLTFDFGDQLVHADGDCCAGEYCDPGNNQASYGQSCSPCLPPKSNAPTRSTYVFLKGNTTVVFDHACCSGKQSGGVCQ